MYTVYFYNLGYTKEFNTLEEAVQYGKKSGFACKVINPQGEFVRTIKVI